MNEASTPGSRLREAVRAEQPLQIVGAINAYHARMAERSGYRALYLSGGGVAAGSLGTPDLGISTIDDVLTDVRRITDVCTLPLLVDADTGFGGALNVARTIRSLIKAGAAGCHIEDQVQAKRCGHRPGKQVVSSEEMVDRIRAAVDARTDNNFVIMARTDALASEGLNAALDRTAACVEAGADMIFPEAVRELEQYRAFPYSQISPNSARRRYLRWMSCVVSESASRSTRCLRFARPTRRRCAFMRLFAATARNVRSSIPCRRVRNFTIFLTTIRTSRNSMSSSQKNKRKTNRESTGTL